jgi:ThiF family/Prokaryotic homologs of the JAB domain
MMPAVTLAWAGVTHEQVRQHLYPGDGLEAAAVLMCARTPGPRTRLIVRDVELVPHGACVSRRPDSITWPGEFIERALDRGEADQLSLILIHSHPGGLFAFSPDDDLSDQSVVPGLFQAYGDLHGTAIMTLEGAVRARVYRPGMDCQPIDLVTVAGDDLRYWWDDGAATANPTTRPLAFTGGMTRELGRLSAAVIGVSGTGSIVGEQVGRLGFGNVTGIDFDRVERRNLNRILNSTLQDAADQRLKVDTFAAAMSAYRGYGVATPVAASVATRAAVLAASQCDVLFCCVDTLEARHFADLMGASFVVPIFDVGVVIPVRKAGQGVAIADVCGRIDYVQPGGSSLADRGVYSASGLRAEYLRKVAPEAHRQELEAGYIKGLVEEAPAVITLNMRAAAACVGEFIARAYPYRLDSNRLYARTQFSLAACEEDYSAEDAFANTGGLRFGGGDAEPLLGLPALKIRKPKSC